MLIRSQKILTRYFFVILALLIIIGVVSSIYVYRVVVQNQQMVLVQRTNTIAQFVDPSTLRSLMGTSADVNNQTYLNFKKIFHNVVLANSDLRFVYFVGRNEKNEIFFYVDSEPSSSPDYSPPGQIYTEAASQFYQAFRSQKPMLTGAYTDRWGTWLTALAPIKDKTTGKVLAVLCMDISANSFYTDSLVYSSIPALVTLLLLILLVSYFILEQREEDEVAKKAELISIASHEIRGPLTGIAWGADRLLKSAAGKLDENQIKILTLTREGCDTLLETVNELLDIYVLQNQNKQSVFGKLEVKKMFSDLVSIMELVAKKKGVSIGLEFLPNQEMELSGDKEKLKRVFSNLLSNAIKYSKDNGQVKISVQDFPTSILFTISDGGIGIPKADQPKVFGAFFRSFNARSLVTQGNGIGLFYVNEVIKKHNGKIWFESKEGIGTTFFVDLPKGN